MEQVVAVHRRVTNKKTGEVEEGCRLYIFTRSQQDVPVTAVGDYSRKHWVVENCIHYVRDVVDQEDNARIRGSRIAAALGVLGTSLLALVRSSGRTSPTLAKEELDHNHGVAIKLLKHQCLK